MEKVIPKITLKDEDCVKVLFADDGDFLSTCKSPQKIRPMRSRVPEGRINGKPCNNNNSILNYNFQSVKSSSSPPYRRIKLLKLFDSPQTPRTIISNSESTSRKLPRALNLFGSAFKKSDVDAEAEESMDDEPFANINPYTPTNMKKFNLRKRTRSRVNLNNSLLGSSGEEVELDDSFESEQPSKRIALQESSISRYSKEFHEIEIIGSGEFGNVYKCINRLDGCVYALKKSAKPIAGSVDEKIALNEVYAHAVLGLHPHVVRYYSAWTEASRMVIQNEYCNCGSLAGVILQNEKEGKSFPESELKRILLHVAEGLRYIHTSNLAHMDIKPGNIFISKDPKSIPSYALDDEWDECEDGYIYKIGDLGHITLLDNPQVEEGDCRYLPKEILHEDYRHIDKADIFALGLSVYEAGGGGPLPKNGDDWHAIRDGQIPPLEDCTNILNDLLKMMVHPDPLKRPPAIDIIRHKFISPSLEKSKTQLNKELEAAKMKNEVLAKQLEEAVNYVKVLQRQRTRHGRLLVGVKSSRSISDTSL